MKYLILILIIVPLSSAIEAVNLSTHHIIVPASPSIKVADPAKQHIQQKNNAPLVEKKWLMQEIRFLADNVPYIINGTMQMQAT
jgi:hypothetical protein